MNKEELSEIIRTKKEIDVKVREAAAAIAKEMEYLLDQLDSLNIPVVEKDSHEGRCMCSIEYDANNEQILYDVFYTD